MADGPMGCVSRDDVTAKEEQESVVSQLKSMAQMEVAMFESVAAKTKNVSAVNKQARPKRECRQRKRPYDLEQFTSKRAKYEQTEANEPAENSCTFGLASDSDEDHDNESKCSTSDETEQPTAAVAVARHVDDNSDLDEIEEDTTNVYRSEERRVGKEC